MYPFLFESNLHMVVWGGNRIQQLKGCASSDAPIGESWEVSAVSSSPSVIANGRFRGRDLISVISEHPEAILGKKVAAQTGGMLPLLVKIIDANKELSIQVHPDDAMAQREHGKSGKSEMWYIISAELGSRIYSGFSRQITEEEYKRRVVEGTITDVLASHEVAAGDVFYIPAGRVHAIGAGIVLAEIQQSSDVTYRIYDYNRKGLDGNPRQLHTELAARALDYHVAADYRTDYPRTKNRFVTIADTPYFTVRVNAMKETHHCDMRKYDSFVTLMCVNGSCKVSIRQTQDELLLNAGSSCLIPASIADYDVIPANDTGCQLLDGFIK